MKCPNCRTILRRVKVSVEGAEKKAISFQCPRCDYFDFERDSARDVVRELKSKETVLKIRQKITKLSQERLGIYFNRNIVESLNLKAGEQVYISVPDKRHIILKIKD